MSAAVPDELLLCRQRPSIELNIALMATLIGLLLLTVYFTAFPN
jgi:hypothetical protein